MISHDAGLRATQLAFAHHLRDPDNVPRPEDVPEQRAEVYRELFFNNIKGALNSAFPVAAELLDAEVWEWLARDFWRQHRSHAPEFPRVAGEFLRWIASQELDDGPLPEFLGELLVWEHAELEAMLAADDDEVDSGDVMIGCPVVSTSLRVYAFRYPVHQISTAFRPTEPAADPVFLACFRAPSLDVDFMELTPAAAWLLEQITERPAASGAEHSAGLAEAIGADPQGTATEVERLFSDFAARGVIIGVRPRPRNDQD